MKQELLKIYGHIYNFKIAYDNLSGSCLLEFFEWQYKNLANLSSFKLQLKLRY
jgi:hypothetical protein